MCVLVGVCVCVCERQLHSWERELVLSPPLQQRGNLAD